MSRIISLIVVCAVLCPVAYGATWYVDVDNTSGTEGGESWATAFTAVQPAVDAAFALGGGEVWVAEGVYREAAPIPNTKELVVMKANVDLYGGFAGLETERDQRDWQTNVTVLDGRRVDGGAAASHVVQGSDDAVIDGFTITGGNASDDHIRDYGGGMFNWQVSPTVANCTFTGNSADQHGGGMYNYRMSGIVMNCAFIGNVASVRGDYHGGGMCNVDSSPTITDCTFEDNRAYHGIGMYNSGSSPIVTNCTFTDNVTTADAYSGVGGGMYNSSGGNPVITGCTFTGNRVSEGGGIYNSGSSATITDCTFTSNDGPYGGGMHNNGASPTVTGCVFANNFADERGVGAYGGGMYNVGSSPIVVNCIFMDNSTTGGFGGGMCNYSDSSPIVVNCMFVDNSTTGVTAYRGTDYGGNGGAVYNEKWSSPTLTNCTFSSNSATGHGGAIYSLDDCSPIVINCVLWGNPPAEIEVADSATTVTYSLVQGGYPGEGNIDADPFFADPPNGDYRLQPGSPCIDAGTTVGAPYQDIDGNRRPVDGDGDSVPVVDIGAYEYDPEPWDTSPVTTSAGVIGAEGDDADHITLDEPVIWWVYEDPPDLPHGKPLAFATQSHYHVRITTEPDGDGAVLWETGMVPGDDSSVSYNADGEAQPLSDGETYYVLVATADGHSFSEWIETSFRINTPPPVPGLITDLEYVPVGDTPQISWTLGADVEGDVLATHVYLGMNQEPAAEDTLTDAGATSAQIGGTILLDTVGPWYYRLASDDGYELSDYTDADSFIVETDNDGDGISDTPDPDDDNDGMPDDWETAHGFNPMIDDAGGDADYDGLSNLYEYQIGTDPTNTSEPPSHLYAATDGSNETGDGTLGNPWQTIAFAMDVARIYTGVDVCGLGAHPVTIHLDGGIYEEAVVFVPDVTIFGAGPSATRIQYFDPYEFEHIIVTAAENTGIRDCTITLPGMHVAVMVLVRIDDVVMEVADCVLDGGDNPNSIGVLIAGVGSSDSVIRDSVIRRMEDGIHAVDTGVNITRNTFEGIHDTAVFVRLPETKMKTTPETPLLGDAAASFSGFNRFRNVLGYYVTNMNPVETKAERNDWGVYTEGEIAAKLFGLVDFEPYIGAALVPGLVTGQVVDGDTGEPIPAVANPEVTIEELASSTTPDPVTGLFEFANVPPGTYTVTATATGYDPASETIDVGDTEPVIVTLTLKRMSGSGIPGDVNNTGGVDAVDVQLVINEALGAGTGYDCDIDCNGFVNAIDVQLVINTALGM